MNPLGHDVEAGWFSHHGDICKPIFCFLGASLIADSQSVNTKVFSLRNYNKKIFYDLSFINE